MKKILLVEDDPFLIDIYTTKLNKVGFEVEGAADGEEALKKIIENTPDLLVLDLILPKIDGWEVLKKIKEEDSLKNIKVIILSNLDQETDKEKILKLGVEKYLIKAHYTPTEVVEEIKKIYDQ